MLGEIIDHPHAIQRVRNMPGVELHRMVANLGLADCAELLALATPEQMREILDLELWQGDRIKVDEALDWLSFMTSFPDEVLSRDLQALDIEFLGFLIKRHTRIYLAKEDSIPPEPEGVFHTTIDGWFILDIVADHRGTVERVIQLVDMLYADDPDRTRSLLQNLMWELPSELEEYSYRWRMGRLEDLGFADPQEALLLYAYLDPTSVHPTERTTDRPLTSDPEPAAQTTDLIKSHFTQASFWNTAIDLIDSPQEQQRLYQALLHLGNRALTADRISPGNLNAAQQSLENLHWRLSLGLEFLCRGELGQSAGILSGVALLRIARVGFSLQLDLRKRILGAAHRGQLGRSPGYVDLLDPPLAQQINWLLAPRPSFFDSLNQEPRAFKTLRDLALANQWIDEALATVQLVSRIDLPAPMPRDVTLGDLFRTAVINDLIGHQGPLEKPSLAIFLRDFVSNNHLNEDVVAAALARAGKTEVEHDLARKWLDRLESSVGALQPDDLDLRFIDGLWLAI